MPVREFLKSDVPQVVHLYWKFMSARKGEAPSALHDSFTDLYFCNPMRDDSAPSFVYEGISGEILGFFGVTTRRMCLSGDVIRVGFAGNFVIHPKARGGVAAPGLLGAYVASNHDLLLTDSANDISRHLFQRVGFKTIPALNIHWARPLQFGQYAVYAMSRGMSSKSAAAFRFVTKPLCTVVDHMSHKIVRSGPVPKTALFAEDLSLETLLHCFAEYHKRYTLWPEYDPELLRWVLQFIRRNKKRGTLNGVELRDESRKIVGWYLYYARPRGIGEVVQVCGKPDIYKAVLEHLFQDAREQGVIALHGVAEYRRISDLSDQGCVFTCRGGWTLAHSRRSELLKILERGDANLSRLDGEWCLNPTE
jgi:hypothetical protein